MKADEASLLEILQEVLYHTQMISQFQPGSDMDLTPHTEACHNLLTSLQDLAGHHPGQRLLDRYENPEVKLAVETALRNLIEQTRQCRHVLQQHLAQTDRELDSLRRKQRQVRAYGSQTT